MSLEECESAGKRGFPMRPLGDGGTWGGSSDAGISRCRFLNKKPSGPSLVIMVTIAKVLLRYSLGSFRSPPKPYSNGSGPYLTYPILQDL